MSEGSERGTEAFPERGEGRAALARLGLILAAGAVAASITGAFTTAAVVVAIVAMIMLHELGHFLVAKAAGMKVTEYFLGFGPKVWSVRRGETEYGLKAIPAGGYVRILGMSNLEHVDPADEPRTYRQASFPRRVAVVSAGSAVHFLLALVLLWAVVVMTGVPTSRQTVSVAGFARIAGVENPAKAAGLEPGDVFVSVDGRPVADEQTLVRAVQAHADRPLRVVVERAGTRRTVTVTPVNARVHAEAGLVLPPGGGPDGAIGVMLTARSVDRPVGVLGAIGQAASTVGRYSVGTVTTLARLFSPAGLSSYAHQLTAPAASAQKPGTVRLESIIGVVRLADQAARTGLPDVLDLLALINVFVGLFNMVPLLPLDGGHVAVAVYERLRSRPGRPYHADMAKLMPLTAAVFAVIVVLGVTAAYLDIAHPLANPFR